MPDKNVTIQFARRTDVMPPVPIETRHHPSAVDLLLIKRLAAETSKQTLLQFLQHEFVNIGKSYAERLIGMYSRLQPLFHSRSHLNGTHSAAVVGLCNIC
ncbi:DNA topoisomerase 6 subunit B-like [Magnolia sinica]|uniref:DNA topoisomerase 6 subunit B-like n=1 Tax=Magnolia sinica TaxID=86752 RepID=UPI0026588598|nr:DNA topoisomerase 6 subunit B-like [Magnolia sinica]